ncbi:hypothetical protein ACFQ9Z_38075 [Streptomyces sp. NPDC056580]|uniref:hypothetical protein n=1 Tax=Streptomyces sp. NPDC056580 TaxID=3345872 RepID=UPI0036AF2FB1
MAALLREEGMDVLFADEEPDREYLASDPDEYWLPILDFGESKSTAIGGVLSKVVKLYLPPGSSPASGSGSPKLHLEFFCEDGRTILEGSPQIVFAIARHLGESEGPPM